MSFLYNTLPDTFEERLETTHLLLRPYEEGDEGDFIQLMREHNTELGPAFTGRAARINALEDARIQVLQLRTDWDNRRTFEFGVWQKKPQDYIGDIALNNLDRTIPKAELGLYFTGIPETKQLVQEALEAVIHFAFENLKLNKVYLRCTAFNEFYGELAASCGFIKEGTLRSDFKGADSGELFDLSYYGLTRQDYEHLQQQQHTAETSELA